MKTIMQTIYSPSYHTPVRFYVFEKFFKWCSAQEKNRFGWLAFSLAAQGCIIAPVVMFAIGITGNSLVLWMSAMIAMGMVLVVNLAAMPAKITIPTFALSIVIDIAIVLTCLIQ